MKYLLWLAMLSLPGLPVLANNPQADFLAAHPYLCGIGGLSPADPKFHIDGAPGATPDQMAQAKQDAQSFDWTVTPDAKVEPAAKSDTDALLARITALEARLAAAGIK